jgi:hypothetical protein
LQTYLKAIHIVVGHQLVVKYRDGSSRLCKIIEKRQLNTEKESFIYYIHYFDFNRRMDEWITTDRILQYPSSANSIIAMQHKCGGSKINA